jgi:hypothetical protein
MRTSFHQPEAQHPNFPLSTSWQADYPILGSISNGAALGGLPKDERPRVGKRGEMVPSFNTMERVSARVSFGSQRACFGFRGTIAMGDF